MTAMTPAPAPAPTPKAFRTHLNTVEIVVGDDAARPHRVFVKTCNFGADVVMQGDEYLSVSMFDIGEGVPESGKGQLANAQLTGVYRRAD